MKTTTAETLADFTAQHGVMVSTAMQWYAEKMHEEAERVKALYDAVNADPERKAAQDISLMTTDGLLATSEAFREAAVKADAALTAWEELTDNE